MFTTIYAAWRWLRNVVSRWEIGRRVNSIAAIIYGTALVVRSRLPNLLSRDIIFNPITWFGFLAIYGIVLGGFFGGVIWTTFEGLYFFNVVPLNPVSWTTVKTFLLLGLVLALTPNFTPEGNIAIERVPQTFFIAYVTLFGMLLPIGRRTGNYPCTGAWVGLGRSTAVDASITDAEGYVRGGDITFEIWQSAGLEVGDPGRTRIAEPAKNGAQVIARLTLILERVKPIRWLNAEDAGSEVGNAARQAYLQFLAQFNDVDLPGVVGIIHEWMTGKPIITAFTSALVRKFRPSSLVRDVNTQPLLTTIREDESEASALDRFTRESIPLVDDAMRTVSDSSSLLPIKPALIKATEPVSVVIERRGYRLKGVTLEGVVFSPQVQASADAASSETFQRAAQEASALAQGEFRKKLGLGPNATESERLSAALAFAQDNPESNAVRVLIVPGEPLAKAAAVVGAIVKDDKS